MARKTRKEKVASSNRLKSSLKTELAKPIATTSPSYTPTQTEQDMLRHTKKDTLKTLVLMTLLVILQLVVYARIDALRALLHQ